MNTTLLDGGDGPASAVTAAAATGRTECCVAPVPGMALRRILWPTDFSAASRQAAPMVAGLARAHGASVTLVHVVPSSLPAEFGHLGLVLETRRLLEEADVAMRRFREEELPEGLGVEVSTVVREGGPPYQVAEVAREREADLIVVCTHGYTGLRHAWLGSTAERVVRHAPCPVLTLRNAAVPLRFPEDRPGCFGRILVPCDFSAAGAKALLYASALGARCGSEYRLLHVVEPPPYPEFGYAHVPQREAALRAEAVARLESVARDHLGPATAEASSPARTSVAVRAGRASFEIAAEAQDWGADLIVVGTRGHSVWKNLLLGSTAEEVVRHAACPVLVVRDREHDFVQVNGP